MLIASFAVALARAAGTPIAGVAAKFADTVQKEESRQAYPRKAETQKEAVTGAEASTEASMTGAERSNEQRKEGGRLSCKKLGLSSPKDRLRPPYLAPRYLGLTFAAQPAPDLESPCCQTPSARSAGTGS
jgi:hypothetical protein